MNVINSWRRPFLAAFLALVSLVPSRLAAQTCDKSCLWGGKVVGCSTFGYWTPRAPDRRELVGSLHHLRRWHDSLDDDWNFILKPDAAFSSLAKRSDGTVNPRLGSAINEPGLVEGEVHSIFELVDTAFATGMRVRAKGWWVEDSKHGVKTELHPLTAIVGQATAGTPGEGDALSVLVSHDWSDRFCVQKDTLIEVMSIPLKTAADSVTLPAYSGTSAPTEVVTESAILDGDIGTNRSELSTTQEILPDGAATLRISPTLFRPHKDAPKNYRPLYLARLTRTPSGKFDDLVSTRLVNRGPNCSGIEVSLSAQLTMPPLNTPPSLPQPSPQWNWVLDNEAPTHGAGFSRTVYYSPCHLEDRTEWLLRASAASSPTDFRPPRGGPGDAGRQAFLSRTPTRAFTQKVRAYRIDPSRVDIAWSTSGPPTPPAPPATGPSGPPAGVGTPLASVCGGTTTLSAITTVAFATLQSEQGFQWVIRQGMMNQVVDVSHPSATGLDFSAHLSSTDPHDLAIVWNISSGSATLPTTGTGIGTPGTLGPIVPTGVLVRAEFNTAIGESPSETVAVKKICWVQGGGRTFADFMRDLPKLEAALRKLGAAEFPHPGGPLPPRIQRLRRGDLVRPPNESDDTVAPARNRGLLAMIDKARSGQTLSAGEVQTLGSALDLARGIQALQSDIDAANRTRGIVPH